MAPKFNELLKKYYETKFPEQLIYDWLNYNRNDNIFKFREFSFTLDGDIYVRYQAFDNAHEFGRALMLRVPIKIDVGAVYNISPKFGRSDPKFKPLQHELVFDIDISDYDDVRNCCTGSNICEKCWPFMRIGAKILNTILREEFGFKHLLFVFSGRRGFHCWVCDETARLLTPDVRHAIADYFTVVTGGQSVVKRVTIDTNGIHPMLVKALNVIEEEFDDLLVNKQDFLSKENLIQNVIDLAHDEPQLMSRLSERCRMMNLTSAQCWKLIKLESSKYRKRLKPNYFIQEVMLQHCFPRLDGAVTRGMNHLLKLPFCVHPKTGNVCVPIDINNIDKFSLKNVPNIENLTPEIMEPYIKVFKSFVDQLKG